MNSEQIFTEGSADVAEPWEGAQSSASVIASETEILEQDLATTPALPTKKPAKTRNKGKFVGFWADECLHAQLKSDAETAGVTVSDYLRELVSGEPVPRKNPAPHAARVEVGKFIGHLGKVGSNLNQIAHQVNRAGMTNEWELMPTAKEIMEACAALGMVLQEIRADLKTTLGRKR